ncbi:MAG: ribonuclease Y [Anaerolineales bacterium]|nr:ribonuclease Y [Anaerolineales bacterium]MCS7246680.1 ribonuclease Y [Anaerolineales bacterium]MDW8160490.1 ribonuclease Y [Anaerolineales bacterium]MDW8446195.1 ribonuclease Y [Anaerolineales bacterium]
MDWPWILTISVFLVGVAGGYLLREWIARRKIQQGKEEAERLIREAAQRASDIELEAKNHALEIRQQAEAEIARRRNELSREEDRLQKRREELDLRADRLEKREQALNKRQSAIDKRANEIEKMYAQELEELQRIANMSMEEARNVLLAEAEKEARADMARIIRQIEAEAREEGENRARKLIVAAIQRIASEHVAEVCTSVVPLPSDEMKGRIIGRNGRNIHAFEQVAGVDVIVDDTPEAVTISCFDPIRREVARRALEKLVLDGRIHPAHIEKVIKNEQKEVERDIVEAGERAAYEAGVTGLHPEVIRMLGRLKYRSSYGQNQLAHAVETARLAAILAAELGADVEVAKAGGLLHDLGKAMDYNMEGTHALLGAEFAKRYGVHPAVVNIIASHHHEVEQESVEAAIVEAADAISGARPGARRESLEQYLKRVRALEEIANSYKGVSQSYALQAGREIRIFVKPEEIDDLESIRLARDIAKKIEESMQYPGQIKVTVIRETRSIDYAR